jgi:hypothetical protein
MTTRTSAGLAKGRQLTSCHTIQDDIRNAGCDWKDEVTIRDKNWISRRSSDDIPAFRAVAVWRAPKASIAVLSVKRWKKLPILIASAAIPAARAELHSADQRQVIAEKYAKHGE